MSNPNAVIVTYVLATHWTGEGWEHLKRDNIVGNMNMDICDLKHLVMQRISDADSPIVWEEWKLSGIRHEKGYIETNKNIKSFVATDDSPTHAVAYHKYYRIGKNSKGVRVQINLTRIYFSEEYGRLTSSPA